MRRIAEKVGGYKSIVFLLEGKKALAAYAVNFDDAAIERFENFVIELDFTENDPCGGVADIERQIRAGLTKVGFNGTDFFAFPMRLDRNLISIHADSPECIGYFLTQADQLKCSPEEVQTELELFTLSIHSRRNQRIIEAVASAQLVLTQLDVESKVDDVIQRVAEEVQDNVSATSCVYQNLNTFEGWVVLKSDEAVDKSTSSEVEFKSTIDHQPISRRLVNFSTEGAGKRDREALHVPLYQPGYKLENLPFSNYSDFIDKLESTTLRISSLVFAGKQNAGYLQKRFSETDRSVAQSVFGYLDQFASAQTFQRNYQKVLRFLKDHPVGDEIAASSILTVLRALSVAFSNVFYVTAEYENGKLRLDHTSAHNESTLSESYLQRLNDNYLSEHYAREQEADVGTMLMGLDKCEGGYDFEIHFPGSNWRSRIFVVRFNREAITESVLRSLLHFFSELEVRQRKTDYDRERASYLMQTRHAVIHHFSAADKGIRHLRQRWNKGIRNVDYWENLRTDPIIKKSVQKAHFSLSQAALILENGRFLLRDINPSSLNRKQFDVEAAVRNAFHILEDQRDAKAITIKSAIYGEKPSVMNADQELMNIAILNLVDNALKFSPNRNTIRWWLEFEDTSYTFSIASGGDIIGEGQKKHILKQGVRGRQQDHLNQRHGTGLGLAVTNRILRAHWNKAQLNITREQFPEIKGGANVFSFEMPYLTGLSNPANRT